MLLAWGTATSCIYMYQFIMLNVKIIEATHELIKSGQRLYECFFVNGYHTLYLLLLLSPHIISSVHQKM